MYFLSSLIFEKTKILIVNIINLKIRAESMKVLIAETMLTSLLYTYIFLDKIYFKIFPL